MARKVCMSVRQFEKLLKKKSCSCGSHHKGGRRRGKRRMPPRVKHGSHKGRFRKRR